MLDYEALCADLDSLGLRDWQSPLRAIIDLKLDDRAHGNLAEWKETLRSLPKAEPGAVVLNADAVTVETEGRIAETCRKPLLTLAPWRKGPFRIGDLTIDAEWQSNLKWDRIAADLEELSDRCVLDVGCGNGYYALRLIGLGARTVIGIDPTLLYVVQHYAIRHFMSPLSLHVLPLRLHELPTNAGAFDTTLSMGVLYHQRDPQRHIEELRQTLRPGGQLILETLILPGDGMEVLQPEDRYARMRNVWHLPSWPQLAQWLADGNFEGIRLIDVSRTDTEEQRSTEWMPFESLAEALDPLDVSLTVEGLPAPRRAVVSCNKAG